MTCKNCGTENSNTSKKCKGCNMHLDGTNVISGNKESKEYVGEDEVLCKNCKKRNPVNALRCLDCNSPLDGSIVINQKARNQGNSAPIAPRGTSIKPNVQTTPVVTELNNCPSCKFPNLAMASICGYCQKPLSNTGQVEKPIIADKTKQSTSKVVTIQPIDTKTINPFAPQQTQSQFMLYPMESEIIDDTNGIKFVGNIVDLNRANLDEHNNTISSKVQAQISLNNGKWVLNDKSSLKSTFVRVGNEIELRDGDVILMGNKLFTFKDVK